MMVRERLTGQTPPPAAKKLVDLWRPFIEERAGRGLDKLERLLEDQRKFGDVVHDLLHEVADARVAREDGGPRGELVGPAEVDHAAEPPREESVLRGRRQEVERVGPEEDPPAGPAPVERRVAADVAQVAGAGEPEVARGGGRGSRPVGEGRAHRP